MPKKIFLIAAVILVFIVLVFFYNSSFRSDKNTISNTLSLKFIKDIPLSGGANRLDYQSIDYNTKRLYISHLGSHMVHVFDLGKQKIVKDIFLSGSPYGILALPSLRKVFVGIGSRNQIAVIDESFLRVTKYIPAGDTPDGIAYNDQTQQIFVSNENGGTVTVINAKTNEHITDIPIGGGVGNSHNFTRQNRVYTTAGNDNKLVEIDPVKDNVVAKYDLPGCIHPHGFYIDEQTSHAYIACDSNNVMLTVDLNSKKILSSDTVGAGPDVLAYDEKTHFLYVAAESGVMTIFDVEKERVKKMYEGFIAPRAHTVAVDQSTHYIYIPLEDMGGKPVLRVLKPFLKEEPNQE